MGRTSRVRCVLFLALLSGVTVPAVARAAEDQKPPKATAEADSWALRANSPWISSLGLGAQFLPNYNDEGKSEGLKEQRFFAELSLDSRFSDRWHGGVKLLTLGTPVVRDPNAQSNPDVVPKKFDDVADTIVAAPYAYWAYWHWPEIGDRRTDAQKSEEEKAAAAGLADGNKNFVHNFGPITRLGVLSRETLGNNRDSVSWFYQLGFQYTYEPYHIQTGKGSAPSGYWNGLPRGFISVAAARYEDYAQLGRQTRIVVDSGFRVPLTTRLYAGFRGNFGKGPDDMALVVAFYFSPDKLLSLFNASDEG